MSRYAHWLAFWRLTVEHGASLPDALCVCGHGSDWHSQGGKGDCEHDGKCKCQSFAGQMTHG